MRYIIRSLSIFFLIITSSCLYKRPLVSDFAVRNAKIPIFIQMPRNTTVFDNISPLLYQAMHHHYMHVGYILVGQPSDGYTMRIYVKRLDPINKLISPDIILFHYTVRLELECMLLNFKQELVTQKKFLFSTLISEPRNPILNSDFMDYYYKRLLERAAPKIEHYFRSFLLNAFE